MNRIRGLWKQLRALFDKDALERELDEELAYHIERETEANIESGMTLRKPVGRPSLSSGAGSRSRRRSATPAGRGCSRTR